jgi:hypothetical protein
MGKSLSLGSSGLPPRRSAFQHAPRALSSEYLSSRFDVHLGKSCPFRSLARFQSTVLICLDRFPLHGVQGSCSIAAKGIHNTAGLVAFRFFLGIIEVSRVLRLPLVPVRWLTGRMVSSAGWVLPRSHPATQLLVQGQSPRVPPSAFNRPNVAYVTSGTAKRIVQATRPLLFGLSYGGSVRWAVGRCDHPVHGRCGEYSRLAVGESSSSRYLTRTLAMCRFSFGKGKIGTLIRFHFIRSCS